MEGPHGDPIDPRDLYTLQNCIGSGSFGKVYKGVDNRSGESVAVKIIDVEKADDEVDDILSEISILSELKSPFITRYHGAHLRGSDLWIIMEFCAGGSCQDLLKAGVFEENYITIIIRELLMGLEYLHADKKLHRDVKAANILLGSSGQVKLADFGVSGQLTATMTKKNTFVGTPFWMAPEVIKQSGYNDKADIWSLGITALELAKGEPPLSEIHPMKVLFLIPKNAPPSLEGPFSDAFKDFIRLCLQKDPKLRPTARELLKHPFVKKGKKTTYLTELIERYERWQMVNGQEDSTKQEFVEDQSPVMIHDSHMQDLWDFGTVRPVGKPFSPITPEYSFPPLREVTVRRASPERSRKPPSHASPKPFVPSTPESSLKSHKQVDPQSKVFADSAYASKENLRLETTATLPDWDFSVSSSSSSGSYDRSIPLSAASCSKELPDMSMSPSMTRVASQVPLPMSPIKQIPTSPTSQLFSENSSSLEQSIARGLSMMNMGQRSVSNSHNKQIKETSPSRQNQQRPAPLLKGERNGSPPRIKSGGLVSKKLLRPFRSPTRDRESPSRPNQQAQQSDSQPVPAYLQQQQQLPPFRIPSNFVSSTSQKPLKAMIHETSHPKATQQPLPPFNFGRLNTGLPPTIQSFQPSSRLERPFSTAASPSSSAASPIGLCGPPPISSTSPNIIASLSSRESALNQCLLPSLRAVVELRSQLVHRRGASRSVQSAIESKTRMVEDLLTEIASLDAQDARLWEDRAKPASEMGMMDRWTEEIMEGWRLISDGRPGDVGKTAS